MTIKINNKIIENFTYSLENLIDFTNDRAVQVDLVIKSKGNEDIVKPLIFSYVEQYDEKLLHNYIELLLKSKEI